MLASSSSSSASHSLTSLRMFDALFLPFTSCRRRVLRLPPLPFSCLSSSSSFSSRTFASLFSGHQPKHEWEERQLGHPVETGEEGSGRFIRVKAFFLCMAIDLRGLQARNRSNVIPHNSRATNYAVLRFPIDDSGVKDGITAPLAAFPRKSEFCYMVVFKYGSVVFFNVSGNDVDQYLRIVKEHASGLLSEITRDDYAVVENQALETWMQSGLDYVVVKCLSLDGIRTIGSVLGQSVALDHYIRQVDGMVAEFTTINRDMEKTGTFTMQRKKLFQLVGKANSNLADVILKLGLLERSDIAWKNANYSQIWEYLRDEFELAQRFGSLDFKLKFVEHNIRFLQEILENRKSDFLEWLVIILICVEILLSLYSVAMAHH